MNRRWARGGFEPPLDELLDEPIAALLRRRDHLDAAEVRAAVGAARSRILSQKYKTRIKSDTQQDTANPDGVPPGIGV